MSLRPQSTGEQIANSVSHGIGFIAVLAGTPFLVLAAIPHGAASIVGVSVFAATLAVLYLTSTLYHALPGQRDMGGSRIHPPGAISLGSAGPPRPFRGGARGGGGGWTLFGIVWFLAVAGVVFTVVVPFRYPIISTAIYVAMGWLVVIAIRPLWQRMPLEGLLLLLAGGLAYTGGVAFYAARNLRYGHLVWHLFVLAGSVFHYLAVLYYAA